MNEFVSWETLGTFAGCAMLVGILTQFTKGLFSKLPTQWLSYIYAVVVMALAIWAAPTGIICWYKG